MVYAPVVEAAVNDLTAVGIRVKVRPMERAAVFAAQLEKTVKNLTFQGSGAFGNAATRIEAFIYSQGNNSFIQDPQIDEWYRQQAKERDRQKREALLHRFSARFTRTCAFCPSGNSGSSAPPVRVRPCQGWG